MTPDRWQDYGRLETTTAPRSYVQHRAQAAAVEAPLPQPQALDAVVWVDAIARVLTVRLPDKAGGYERFLWTQAWQQLRRAQEAGWPLSGAPAVWADLPAARQVAHGQPGEAGTLLFSFPPGKPGFAELISKPGVVAIVTVDRSAQRFLGCKSSAGRAVR